MSYTALYRKWRPTDFNDVKGQDHIVQTLQNQIKADRLGHAYLFCGTRGTGKTSVAKILAKAVNCEHPVDGNPCGECPTCKAIAAGTSMNVIEIDAASNNGVDNIREIRDEVMYSPTEGKYKVYIIDEVHMLSIGAFNALLKTLEEPPAYVIFILATTEAHKIPITILSRCQRYDFHRISIETISDRLIHLMQEEHINVEDRAIRYIAKAADGSMRDALSLLDQCIAFYLGKDLKYDNVLEVLGAVDVSVFADMLNGIVKSDTAFCMELLERIVMQGRDLSQFVTDFIWYLRNLLLVKTMNDDSKIEDVIDVSADNLKVLKKDSEIIDVDSLMKDIRIMSELANDLKFTTQKRIKVEIALIKLTRPAMDNRQDLSDIVGRLCTIEAQLNETRQQLKDGRFTSASTNVTGNASNLNAGNTALKEEKDSPNKRIIEALPEDVKKLAKEWDSIVYAVEDPLKQGLLKQAKVTLAQDGKSLELMFQSPLAYNTFEDEVEKQKLSELIENVAAVHVNIVVTKLESDEDFRNRFTDIRELVNINIEVDDKEEYI